MTVPASRTTSLTVLSMLAASALLLAPPASAQEGKAEDGGEVFIDCRRKRELNQIPLELRFDLLVKLFGEVGVKRLRNFII